MRKPNENNLNVWPFSALLYLMYYTFDELASFVEKSAVEYVKFPTFVLGIRNTETSFHPIFLTKYKLIAYLIIISNSLT